MTSTPPGGPAQPAFRWVAKPGQLIGFIVVSILLSITLKEVFGTEFDWDFPSALIGWAVGGTIGGLIQLRRQGRLAETGSLIRQQLSAFAICAPVFLAAWLGAWLYGRVGWWVGVFGGCGLVMVVSWLVRRSSQRRKDSITP